MIGIGHFNIGAEAVNLNTHGEITEVQCEIVTSALHQDLGTSVPVFCLLFFLPSRRISKNSRQNIVYSNWFRLCMFLERFVPFALYAICNQHLSLKN